MLVQPTWLTLFVGAGTAFTVCPSAGDRNKFLPAQINLTQPVQPYRFSGDWPRDLTTATYSAHHDSKLPFLSVLQNALRALVDLSRNNYNAQPVARRYWRVPPYDNVELTVMPLGLTMRTKYVMWGIMDAVDWMLAAKSFADCKNVLKLRDRAIGDIYIQKYNPPLQPDVSMSNRSSVAAVDDAPEELLTLSNRTSLGVTPSLTIDFTYDQPLLPPSDFFLGAYFGILYAAQNGNNDRVSAFRVYPFTASSRFLVEMLDPPSGMRTRPPFFEMGHIVYLLDRMVQHAVAERNYRELVGALKVDGVPVGQMEIRRGQPIPTS